MQSIQCSSLSGQNINVKSIIQSIETSVRDREYGDIRSILDEHTFEQLCPTPAEAIHELEEYLSKHLESVEFEFNQEIGWSYEEKD